MGRVAPTLGAATGGGLAQRWLRVARSQQWGVRNTRRSASTSNTCIVLEVGEQLECAMNAGMRGFVGRESGRVDGGRRVRLFRPAPALLRRAGRALH